MSSNELFEALTRCTANAVTRRQALRGLAAGLGAALLSGVGARSAGAAPRTCVQCDCGTGQPCNVKLSQCQETRGFPASTVCQDFCARKGQRLCGTGSPFHCPSGCGGG